jgi:hypothetical protein
MQLIENSNQYWSFWTVRLNAVWALLSGMGAAFWVATNQPTRDWLLSLLPGGSSEVVIGLVLGASAAISAGTMILRGIRQPALQPDAEVK